MSVVSYRVLLGISMMSCISSPFMSACLAQAERNHNPDRGHSVIDDIVTGDDVDRFMHRLDTSLKFYSDRVVDMNDSLSRLRADEHGLVPWAKVDLDHNGYTDLLVMGSAHRYEHFWLVLDYGHGKYEWKGIRGPNQSWPDEGFHLASIDGQTYIIHMGLTEYNGIEQLRIDTLVYHSRSLVEVNRTPNMRGISHIQFSTDGCYGTCPIFSLDINGDGAATFVADSYNDLKGTFQGVIDTGAFVELIELIQYIDITRLQDQYAVDWTDDRTCVLSVCFDDGTRKTIEDYGAQGTYSLSHLYELLHELRETQAWR